MTPTGEAIFRVAEAGGEAVPIAAGLPMPELIGVSPDGQQLLLRNSKVGPEDISAWTVPASGGAAHRFGQVQALNVAWRPDGGAVAFSVQSDVRLADPEGEHIRRLVTLPGPAGALAWSADGGRLAVASSTNILGSADIWEVDSRSGAVAHWLHTSALDDLSALAWSRDQNDLIFRASRTDNGVVELLALPLAPGRAPAVKPTLLREGAAGMPQSGPAVDGRGRVVVSGPSQIDQVVRYDRLSALWIPLLDDAKDVNFSRDGARMTYVRASDLSLWVADASGAHPRELVNPPTEAMLPRWSPGGRQLAFEARTPAGPWRLWLIGADSQGLRALPDPDPANGQGAPTWSPDGGALIYADVLCGAAADCGVHRVDLHTGTVSLVPGSLGFRTARWSPDGRWVAALEARSDNIMVLDLAQPISQRRWRRLWPHPVDDSLAWSADSRSLYFVPLDADNARIERLSLAPGAAPVLEAL